MERFISIISCSLAVSSFTYIFYSDIFLCLMYGIATFFLLLICFAIENAVKTKGNMLLNRLLYYITPNDKKYNISSKQVIYNCKDNDEYSCLKKLKIYPNCNDLDRINDRFLWSAPTKSAKIYSLQTQHEIKPIWQQDMWTCYTVYFGEPIKKHEEYDLETIIDDLVDTNKSALPFLSTTIDHKTELITLTVKFCGAEHPQKAQFKIYSTKNATDEIYFEELSYDSSVNGYSKAIRYPRMGWKYVISW